MCEFSAFSILFPCGGEGRWGHLLYNEGGGTVETLLCNHFHVDCKQSLFNSTTSESAHNNASLLAARLRVMWALVQLAAHIPTL